MTQQLSKTELIIKEEEYAVQVDSTLLESFPKYFAAAIYRYNLCRKIKTTHGLETVILAKGYFKGQCLAGVWELEWQTVPNTNVQLP